MREFDALKSYPLGQPRVVGSRTIKHRLIASERGRDFYDGDRDTGYGGLHYDGRWAAVAQDMCAEYNLHNKASVLQLGCDKGFLLHEFLRINPLMRVRGTEVSIYARNHAMQDIRLGIRLLPFTAILPFKYDEFDLVIALGVVYTLNLPDAVACLREIERVGKRAFVTLGAYETEEDERLLRSWSLLGTTFLRPEEWIEVMQYAGYRGDYKFITAKSLRLCVSS